MPSFALPEKTLPQMLHARATGKDSHRVAIRQKRFGIFKPTSWAQYYIRARNVGLGLSAIGLSAGGHAAIISENRIEWVLTQMGVGLVGAVTVGVYPTNPASEVKYLLTHADVEVVICEDQEQSDKVLEALPELPNLKKIVVMETKGLRNFPQKFRTLVTSFAEVESLGAELDSAGQGHVIDTVLAQQTLDDIGLIIYTSGSTGLPKGAMISWRNMRGVALGIIERLGLDANTTHLSYLPLCHVAEQMLTTFVPLYLGTPVNFGESIRTIQEDLREVAPTSFLGVPRIWEKLHAAIHIQLQETGYLRRALWEYIYGACYPLASKPRQHWRVGERLKFFVCYFLMLRALQNFIGLRRARVALTGAAPIAPDVLSFFRVLGVPLVEGYGLTESTGMITCHRSDQVVPGTVGPVTEGVTWCIAPDTGELRLKGDMVFAGYYKNPQATAQIMIDGWLCTGDVVREENGQLKIVDRLKDIQITAGGKNLAPSEIENTMKASPYIKECIVVAEGRKFVAALIQIDFDVVGKWAESRGIAFTHFRSLVETAQVRDLIDAEVQRGNSRLAQVAHIRRFYLLTKELDHDDGEVTATLKVRRNRIYQAYAEQIEMLYH